MWFSFVKKPSLVRKSSFVIEKSGLIVKKSSVVVKKPNLIVKNIPNLIVQNIPSREIGGLIGGQRGFCSVAKGKEENTTLLDNNNFFIKKFSWEKHTKKLGLVSEIGKYYHVGDVIGHGSYGVVRRGYRACDGTSVAIKQMNKRVQTQYKKEATLSARVDHPTVSSPIDVFETNEEVLIVSELFQGGELFDFVADHNMYLGTLNEENVLQITREMLRALESCHRAAFAHLDVKPENFVFRIPRGELLYEFSKIRDNLVLIDFGAAQPFRLKPYATTSDQYEKDMDDTFNTRQSTLGGTASYVSPEILAGRFSSRSDIWSLGVTLFMLIAGRRPFDTDFECRQSVFDVRVQQTIQKEAALPLGTSLYSTCEELGLASSPTVDLLLNMMHPEPELRKSATELIADIDKILEHLEIEKQQGKRQNCL